MLFGGVSCRLSVALLVVRIFMRQCFIARNAESQSQKMDGKNHGIFCAALLSPLSCWWSWKIFIYLFTPSSVLTWHLLSIVSHKFYVSRWECEAGIIPVGVEACIFEDNRTFFSLSANMYCGVRRVRCTLYYHVRPKCAQVLSVFSRFGFGGFHCSCRFLSSRKVVCR